MFLFRLFGYKICHRNRGWWVIKTQLNILLPDDFLAIAKFP